MEDENKKLNNFVAKKTFSEDKVDNEIFRDIFYDLTTKYKDETPRQHLIRAIITIYEKKYPKEMAAFDKEMQRVRETRDNEYAADKKQDQRLLFKFPTSLWNRLTLLVKDPEFLNETKPNMTKEEKEEWSWFMQNFPEFIVPKEI